MRRWVIAAALVGFTGLAQGGEGDRGGRSLASETGYYEGRVTYSAKYMTDREYTRMSLASHADFWLSLERTGPGTGRVHGEGVAYFSFKFEVDWGMNAKVGISLMNVMGVKLDPKVTLTLDETTSVQPFTLSGDVALTKDGDNVSVEKVSLAWKPPDASDASKPAVLRLQLIGTLTADVSGSHSAEGTAGRTGGREGLGSGEDTSDAEEGSERAARDPIDDEGDDGAPVATGSGEAGFGGSREVVNKVIQTIEVPPLSPFGGMTFPLKLVKRTPYGPYVDVYEFNGPGSAPATELSIRSLITQRIDYEWARRVFGEPGGAGEDGATGRRGAAGDDGAEGTTGERGDRGEPGSAGAAGPAGPPGERGPAGPSPFVRAGTARVPVGRDHPVAFSAGLSGDSYVLALTPRASSGLKVSAAYTAKSATGFTIHLTPLTGTAPAGATVEVDWVACEAR